jgi:hypothetical protein
LQKLREQIEYEGASADDRRQWLLGKDHEFFVTSTAVELGLDELAAANFAMEVGFSFEKLSNGSDDENENDDGKTNEGNI